MECRNICNGDIVQAEEVGIFETTAPTRDASNGSARCAVDELDTLTGRVVANFKTGSGMLALDGDGFGEGGTKGIT